MTSTTTAMEELKARQRQDYQYSLDYRTRW